jgi:hypothetical protein
MALDAHPNRTWRLHACSFGSLRATSAIGLPPDEY